MNKILVGLLASLLVVSCATAQCSEGAVSRLVNRLDKAQRALDRLNTKIDNLEIQRQTFEDRKANRLAYLEGQRTRYLIDIATTEASVYCFEYPAQCATQINNFSQSLQQVNKSIANIERQFNRKINNTQNQINRLATVTIPAQEVAVATLESRIAACNS